MLIASILCSKNVAAFVKALTNVLYHSAVIYLDNYFF